MTTEFEENRRNLFAPKLGANETWDYSCRYNQLEYEAKRDKNHDKSAFYTFMCSLEPGKNPDA